jgi:thioredoxin 1
MASDSILQLDDSSFADATRSGVVLVDFWAPWCGPCQMQGPILHDVADAVGDAATIAKVNVDRAPATATEFGIRSIPTLILLRDGEVVDRFVGVQQASTLLTALGQAQVG